jgi:hypothetical protein
MLSACIVTTQKPDWVPASAVKGRAPDAWLIAGSTDCVLPLYRHGEELRAATVLTPRAFGPILRAQQNETAQRRRAGKRAERVVRRAERGGRPREAPDHGDGWEDGPR